MYDKEEGNKKEYIKNLEVKIQVLQTELVNPDDKFLSDTIGLDDYNRMAAGLTGEIKRLNSEKKQIEKNESNFEKHFSYGITFLTHISFYFMLQLN